MCRRSGEAATPGSEDTNGQLDAASPRCSDGLVLDSFRIFSGEETRILQKSIWVQTQQMGLFLFFFPQFHLNAYKKKSFS